MEKRIYQQFNQTVYHQKLDNGMDVTLIPRQGFKKAYGILTTNYGSVDNRFFTKGSTQITKVPDGIAHFLEHKMFEKADHDAFDIFGEQGSDANAFTSYTQTSYQFSGTTNIQKNVRTLLDFVQSPYFSVAGVRKEQGIIGQEIKMYNDNPDSRLYTGTIAHLYPNDPMHIDIAGTVESIGEITPELLMKCYKTFYQPNNLKLVVVGNIDPETTLNSIVDEEQLHRGEFEEFQRGEIISQPNGKDVIKTGKEVMPITRPKAMIGIRGLRVFDNHKDRLKYKLACELMLEMLLDDTTENYLQLYNAGLIDDSFSFSFEMERGFHFATISSDTDEPERLFEEIQKILLAGIDKLENMTDEFMNTKRGALGRLIMSLNSPEAIANRYSSSLFGLINIFDEIEILRSITMEDLYAAYQQFIAPFRLTEFMIQPN